MTARQSSKMGRQVLPENIYFSPLAPLFVRLFFTDPTKKRQICWELQLENGQRLTGQAKRNCLNLPPLPAGQHALTLIVGKPLLMKGVRIHQSTLHASLPLPF